MSNKNYHNKRKRRSKLPKVRPEESDSGGKWAHVVISIGGDAGIPQDVVIDMVQERTDEKDKGKKAR